MKPHTPRTLAEKKEPSVARAAIIFGVVLVGSLVAGVLLSRHEGPDVASRIPSESRSAIATPQDEPVAIPAAASASAETWDSVVASPTETVTSSDDASESMTESAETDTGPVAYQDAEAAYLSGDYEFAADLFDRYVLQRPNNPWGHYMHGLALRRVERFADAEEAFLACLAIDPDHGKALVNLARVRLDDDRALEAEDVVRRAATLDPENVDAQRVLARALHTQGRRAEALEIYAAALAIDPADAWSLNNRGLILIEEERFAEAADALTAACDADATQAVFHNNLGVALERTGRFADAEQAYAAALAIDTGYEKAAVSLARVEGKTNDVGPAAAAPVFAKSDPASRPDRDPEADTEVAFPAASSGPDLDAGPVALATAETAPEARDSAPGAVRVAPADPPTEDAP